MALLKPSVAKFLLFLVLLPFGFIIFSTLFSQIIFLITTVIFGNELLSLGHVILINVIMVIIITYIFACFIAISHPDKVKNITLVLFIAEAGVCLLGTLILFLLVKFQPFSHKIIQDSPAPGCIKYSNNFNLGGMLRCSGKTIITNLSMSTEMPCLSISLDNCWGGSLDIVNNCMQDIIINDLTLKYPKMQTTKEATYIKLYSEDGLIYVAFASDYGYHSTYNRADWAELAKKNDLLTAHGQIENESFEIEVRKSDVVVPEIDCLQFSLGTYAAVPRTLFVENYCQVPVTIEGRMIPPYAYEERAYDQSYAVELYVGQNGEFRSREFNKSVQYIPAYNETLYAKVTVGSQNFSLSYTKTARLC